MSSMLVLFPILFAFLCAGYREDIRAISLRKATKNEQKEYEEDH